jgi:hypothetical protein
MADDADRANQLMEEDLERRIAAARSPRSLYALECDMCAEPLTVHRRPMGRCIDCQREHERMTAFRGR